MYSLLNEFEELLDKAVTILTGEDFEEFKRNVIEILEDID